MLHHVISGTVLCLATTFILPPAHALKQQELVANLEAGGHLQVGEANPKGVRTALDKTAVVLR